jgi:hypothetical protein
MGAHVGVRGADRIAVCAERLTTELATVSTADPGAHVGVVRAARDASILVATNKLDAAILRTQAKEALTGLGWKSAIAHVAVSAAAEDLGADVTLEQLIFASLRRCPVPKA